MSDNNKNEWIDWIEDAITREYFKYYDYSLFNDVREIGTGGFGKVYRANWKNSKYFALKSFSNFNDVTAKEVVHEVIFFFKKKKGIYDLSNLLLISHLYLFLVF
jgi:hypothetical protein